MTKYMTPEGFAEAFFERLEYDVFRACKGNSCDTILAQVFGERSACHNDICEHLEAQVEEALTFDGPSIELIGYNFHKGFRAWDPIDSDKFPMLNGIVWTAIRGSEQFWEILNDLCKLLDHGTQETVKALDTGV